MAISKITTKGIADDSVTSAKLAAGAVTVNDIPDGEISFDKLSQVNLAIAPEVLEIQVSAPAAGQDVAWLWTWEQSTLPYARRTITNSPEISVPLYKQGTYTVNNYAAYDLFDSMTQTHTLYFKWIDSAGTDNLVSWATSTGPVSDSHPDINGGAATDVQRISINVPATVTPPTLTAPSVSYSVTNNGSGAYTFSGSAAGDNPNIGPFYRGGTYTFNVSATGHPLYLTTDNGTNFSSGTYFGEYTDGVTGSRTDSGTVTITVPSDAPDTLYYQCGNHSAMRGAITIKDLAVETNVNGNYVIYAMHTQEGHKTPIEIRPIPSLVNQMCLVYDATSGKFVPQDLATYVENTPSFENKIREVAGTAELVVEDGSAVIAKVNVYDDSTYLPLTGNNAGDQAFATDTDILYIWDGSAWQQAGASNSDDLTEGSTNLFYTDARVQTVIDTNTAGFITSADNGDAATLDGLDSTQFLRSDTDDTTTGSLTVTGDYIGVPVAAADPSSTGVGQIYYSTTANALRNYTGATGGWQNVSVQPPKVTNVTGIINEDTSSTITITGENFANGTVVKITGAAVGNVTRSLVTTFVNETTITADTNATNVTYVGGASYGVLVENLSGLTGEWASTGTVDRDPVWNAPAAGSNNTINDHNYGGQSYIDGTDRVWVFKGGAGEWRAPATTTAEILLVGGGGGGGTQVGGGGGGGAVLYTNSFSMTEGTFYRFNVGVGGTGGGAYVLPGVAASSNPGTNIASTDGGDTYFGILNNEIVARGGGAGANHNEGSRRGNHFPTPQGNGRVGGSGGGGAGDSGGQAGSGGAGSPYTYTGWTAHGNSGGTGTPSQWAGGGGGGAGGAGGNSSADTGGTGGIGVQYSISGTATYYGGGGGGSFNQQQDAGSVTATVPGGGGRGCGDNCYLVFGTDHGEDGQPNTGGGGGGTRDVTGPGSPGGSHFVERAGNGGTGIIYIRYPIADENSIIVNLDATDPDGDAVSYSSSSTMPGGLALGNDVTGFPNEVGGSTTYPITATATSNSQSENRSFNIIVNPTNDGSSPSRAATNAASIKSLTGTTLSGWYWINVNGTATQVFCDMSTNNGGWMQGMNINTRDGHIVHYVNYDFWESSSSTTSFPAGRNVSTPSYYADDWSHWYQDWKALGQGNLWANYSGTQLLVVVHTNGSYLGWKSFNLNTGSVTKFSQFWQGGSSAFGYTNPSSTNVTYARRITNGAIAQDNGSLSTAEPLVRNGVNLVANAKNYSEDLNRLTVTTSTSAPSSGTASFPVSDNSGGGLGTYYDISPGGRPECDGQIFFTGTWSNGRIGDDHLNDSNYTSWNGKSNGNSDTYNWNSGSGLNYDYAFFIK